jgi:hypothetical protein
MSEMLKFRDSARPSMPGDMVVVDDFELGESYIQIDPKILETLVKICESLEDIRIRLAVLEHRSLMKDRSDGASE